MQLPEHTRLTYDVRHEAWHWESVSKAVPSQNPGVGIHASHEGGGVSWEFSIEYVPNIGLRLKMFDDSWQAFQQIPEFFSALATGAVPETLTDVRTLLDGLGAEDITQRENPYAETAAEDTATR